MGKLSEWIIKGSIYYQITRIIADEKSQDKLLLFTTRYLFQVTVHSIWRERNKRRHKEAASPPALLVKLIDKTEK